MVLAAGVAAIGGVAASGAQRAHLLDDTLHAVGVRPHREANPRDVQLLAAAAADVQTLVQTADALAGAGGLEGHDRQFVHSAQRVARTHAQAVAAAVPPTPAPVGDPSVKQLKQLAAAAADARANDALSAVAVEVAQVLASMAAGLDSLSA